MRANFWLGTINLGILAFLAFRIGVPFVNETASVLSQTDSIGVFLAAQANQFALLQVLLSAVGIGIAIAAVWGYNQIKSGAEKMALEKVNEVVPKLVKEALEKLGPEEMAHINFNLSMGRPPKGNLKDVLSESIELLGKDPFKSIDEE